MGRLRYWKLSADDVSQFDYNADKLLNWDIKCIREPEEDAVFIGVFMYRHGTPFDYVPIKGITYFHNNIPREEIPAVTKFLKKRFGGSEMEKGERIFLKDSREIYSPKEISSLARDMEAEFHTKATITLEFSEMDDQEKKDGRLPDAKLLPIP